MISRTAKSTLFEHKMNTMNQTTGPMRVHHNEKEEEEVVVQDNHNIKEEEEVEENTDSEEEEVILGDDHIDADTHDDTEEEEEEEEDTDSEDDTGTDSEDDTDSEEEEDSEDVALIKEMSKEKDFDLTEEQLAHDAHFVYDLIIKQGFTFGEMVNQFFTSPNVTENSTVTNGGDSDLDYLCENFDDNWDLRDAMVLVLGREAKTEEGENIPERVDQLISALINSSKYVFDTIVVDCPEIKCFDWTSVEPMRYIELLEEKYGPFKGTKNKEDFISANEDAMTAFTSMASTGVDFSAFEDEEDRIVVGFEPKHTPFPGVPELIDDRAKTLSQVAMHIRLSKLRW
jgi:hypothetical protein